MEVAQETSIVALKQAEEHIRKNERFLQAVFDGILDGISVLDKDLNIVRVNRTMEEWYVHMMPLVGKKCFWAYHGRSTPCEVCPTVSAMKDAVPKMEEVPLTGQGGVLEGWLELHAFPMFDDDGACVGVIEHVRNITERKRMEQYVLRTERLAAMGRLAAALAHEINNPLHAIGNGLELVLDFSLGEEERRGYLQTVRQEIERLMTLTGRMLDFSRPPKVERWPISIVEATRYALALANKQLQHRRIQVKADLPDDLPPVLASYDHMAQVFLNLIINAIEAMPEGGVLDITARQVEGRVELTFTDSGVGIAPEALAMIFEPFYTTKEDGTGLGLATSYGILQQHNGAITARNAPEGGAIFTVTLSLAPL